MSETGVEARMDAFQSIQGASQKTLEALAEANQRELNASGDLEQAAFKHRMLKERTDELREEARFEAWCKRYLRGIYEAEKKAANAAAVGDVG